MFTSPRAFEAVARGLGEPRAHLERAKGTAAQNRTYCSKEGSFEEFGEVPRQGRRTDLDEIRSRIENGTTEFDIAKEHFSAWCQYRRSFERFRVLMESSPRSWKTLVVWIYGPTGTGKTRLAHSQSHPLLESKLRYSLERYCGDELASLYPAYTLVDPAFQWVDGYRAHGRVLIDDYRGEASLATLLRVFDRYPMQLPVKGGFVEWSPKIIFVTSNWTPRECYRNIAQDELRPLYRRIDFLFELDTELKDISNTIRF